MKMLTAFALITMLIGCAASETTACPPADQWIEPGSGPMTCETGSKDTLQPYAI